jgi:hypothetical protein
MLEFIESSDVIQDHIVIFLAGEVKERQVKLFGPEIIVLYLLIILNSRRCSSEYIFQLIFLRDLYPGGKLNEAFFMWLIDIALILDLTALDVHVLDEGQFLILD